MNSKEAAAADTEIPDQPDGDYNSAISVPLLLNPAYARTKSLSFDELQKFRISLKWCALDHSSTIGKVVSYATFVLLTIIIPAATLLSIKDPITASATRTTFNKTVQLPMSALATISFVALCIFFRRYGLRQLLFLDGLHDDSAAVHHGYTRELDRAFKYLTYIMLPTLSVELAHKIVFFASVSITVPPFLGTSFPWKSIAFLATLVSWVYRTGVFLLVCVLFRLTCELQILRFEGLYKMFDRCGGLEAGDIYREYRRIKRQCMLTSHRYRIFILGCLVTITISQLGGLMLVLASKTEKNFCNSGDLVVCSAVQLSGFFMCLFGAARITHRAQRVVSVASRWHMIMSIDHKHTSASNCSPELMSSQTSKVPSTQEASSFHSRQALVMYLQHNGGGITLFGFQLDRGMLHALFVFEMTLVLWILSKVVVLT